MSAEYWVMRILPADTVIERAQAKVDSGDLAYINGELCEPIEVYAEQTLARSRAVAEHKRTGHVHKVVLASDLE